MPPDRDVPPLLLRRILCVLLQRALQISRAEARHQIVTFRVVQLGVHTWSPLAHRMRHRQQLWPEAMMWNHVLETLLELPSHHENVAWILHHHETSNVVAPLHRFMPRRTSL